MMTLFVDEKPIVYADLLSRRITLEKREQHSPGFFAAFIYPFRRVLISTVS